MAEQDITTAYPYLDSVRLASRTVNIIREKHPELPEPVEANIVLTLGSPDQVYEGNKPDTNMFVKRAIYRNERKHLRVATKRISETTAVVSTAYPSTQEIKWRLVWDSNDVSP